MLQIVFFIVLIMVIFLLWVMLYDTGRFVTTTYKITDKRIKKDFRAVVVADLHNKSFGNENQRLVEAIRALHPDFILIPGDLITAKPRRNFDIAMKFLKQISMEYPVYYADGNHEHRLFLYPEVYGDMSQKFEEGLRECKVKRLINEKLCFEELGICLYGAQIERKYYKRFRLMPMDANYMESILGPKADEAYYNVLMAHRPDYFPNYAAWGADLVLAGHVHGGVVRIPFWGRGVLSPSVTFFPKYDGGLFEEQNKKMILSRGLGTHTIPFRLFNPGELVVVDFGVEKTEVNQ